MTDQEINVLLAKWAGWTAVHNCNESIGGYWPKSPEGENLYELLAGTPDIAIHYGCPDYTEDLNAVAGLEAKLSDEQHSQYQDQLWKIVEEIGNEGGQLDRLYTSATAPQRALALVRALGLEGEHE
jgi:hypothetical protein